MPEKSLKVPVSERAIMARINRKLAAEGHERLKKTRGDKWRSDLGDYYIVDGYRNSIERAHCSLESLAAEMRVLQPFEALIAD